MASCTPSATWACRCWKCCACQKRLACKSHVIHRHATSRCVPAGTGLPQACQPGTGQQSRHTAGERIPSHDPSKHDSSLVQATPAVRAGLAHRPLCSDRRALNAYRTSASAGGGLDNEGGTVTISNSTFSGNSASYGGGLENGNGTVSISNSTFSGNSAPGPAPTASGGGLDNFGGTLSISNSTFSGNSASSGQGGGLSNYGGTLSISNS